MPARSDVSAKAVIERLQAVSADDTLVLSVYLGLPPDPGERARLETRLRSLLGPLRECTESGELGRTARLGLRADLQRVEQRVEEYRAVSGRGVGLFLCDELDLDERLALPRNVRDRAIADTTPWLRPLLAVLDESWRYGVAVVDRDQAWLYVFAMGELEAAVGSRHEPWYRPAEAWHRRDESPGKARADEWARRQYRDTSERLSQLLRRGSVDLLVVGGHHEIVAAFLPYLPHDVRAKVAGTFSIDPHHMTADQVRHQAERVVDEYERAEERHLVAEALDLVGSGGFATVGLPWCLDAVNAQAVQLLLADDDRELAGAVCPRCSWLGVTRPSACPVCGGSPRSTPDIVDEAAAAVIDAGGEVEHVYADTPLRQHVVASLTRFPVPRPD
jgi:peptide chain release factor subunit 1